MLTTLTEKGVQALDSNPARLREVNRDVEELGARVLHQRASLGAHDFVDIVEAPDDVTIAKALVALGARGSSKLESPPLVSVDDLLASPSALAVCPPARTGNDLCSTHSEPVARGLITRGLDGRPACGQRGILEPGVQAFGRGRLTESHRDDERQ